MACSGRRCAPQLMPSVRHLAAWVPPSDEGVMARDNGSDKCSLEDHHVDGGCIADKHKAMAYPPCQIDDMNPG